MPRHARPYHRARHKPGPLCGAWHPAPSWGALPLQFQWDLCLKASRVLAWPPASASAAVTRRPPGPSPAGALLQSAKVPPRPSPAWSWTRWRKSHPPASARGFRDRSSQSLPDAPACHPARWRQRSQVAFPPPFRVPSPGEYAQAAQATCQPIPAGSPAAVVWPFQSPGSCCAFSDKGIALPFRAEAGSRAMAAEELDVIAKRE